MSGADSALWTVVNQRECDAQAFTQDTFRQAVKEWLGQAGRITKVKAEALDGVLVWRAWGFCKKCDKCEKKFRFKAEGQELLWEQQGACGAPPADQVRQQHCQRLAHMAPMQVAWLYDSLLIPFHSTKTCTNIVPQGRIFFC